MSQIDVIIPCYNSGTTLARAVYSALAQVDVAHVWVIDDGSQDDSYAIAQSIGAELTRIGEGHRYSVERLAQNYGAATARNWGAMRSQSARIAFLDADDAYEQNALEAPALALQLNPEIGLIRLALHPIGLAEEFTQHAGFAKAWRSMEMTGAGNTVWQRNVFLATGGFPQDPLFKQLGGEDAALTLALPSQMHIGTLFDEPGVLHYCQAGTHAERLLRSHLFGETPEGVTPEVLAQANAISARITQQVESVRMALNMPQKGVAVMVVERHTS